MWEVSSTPVPACNSSFFRKALCICASVVMICIIWTIDDGRLVTVLHYPWVSPILLSFTTAIMGCAALENLKVHDLLLKERGGGTKLLCSRPLRKVWLVKFYL